MKKVLAMILSLTLVVTLTIGGSIAYLTSEDSDVNVMTLGNVQIDQIEQQRVENEDGTYADALEPYEDNQTMLPAVYLNGQMKEDVKVGDYTIQMRDESVKNYIDKIVTVKNTGKTDAYVRTIIALPNGGEDWRGNDDASQEWLHWNGVDNDYYDDNNGWMWGDSHEHSWPDDYNGEWDRVENVLIDGIYYDLYIATNKNIIPAGETTAPNLVGVYMDSRVNYDHEYVNADGTTGAYFMEKTDAEGNKTKKYIEGIQDADGKLNILVATQAVQAAGFADAWTALDEAFGNITVENHPWVGRTDLNAPIEVKTFAEFKEALKTGGNIKLMNDIIADERIIIEDGVVVYLDMNGQKISADSEINDTAFLEITPEGKLTIDGNGTIDLDEIYTMSMFIPRGELVIENGTFIRKIPEGANLDIAGVLFVGTRSDEKVVINGGYFDGGYYNPKGDLGKFEETDKAGQGKPSDKNQYRLALKDNITVTFNFSGYGSFTVYGGTFVGANPAWGDEGCALPKTPRYLRPWSNDQGTFLEGQQVYDDKIVLPDGYEITESNTDDDIPTYTVKYTKP